MEDPKCLHIPTSDRIPLTFWTIKGHAQEYTLVRACPWTLTSGMHAATAIASCVASQATSHENALMGAPTSEAPWLQWDPLCVP